MRLCYPRSVVLSWFRTRAAHLAVTLLVSLSTFGGSLIVPHADEGCHDHTCAVYVGHDAAAHRFQAAGGDAHEHPLHCLACHWARSFRPRAEAAFQPAPPAERTPRPIVDVAPVVSALLAAQPPLRSPPTA